MDIEKIVKEFEQGKDFDPIFLEDGDRYVILYFNVYCGDIDVFVNDFKKVTLPEDVNIGELGYWYKKGTTLYVERYSETPTIYGHEKPFKKLVKELNKMKETEKKEAVTNFETEWGYLEEYL